MKICLIIITISFLLSNCEFTIKKGEDNKQVSPKIRNGILVNENGIKLEQAFLLKVDGSLLPEDNKIEVKEKIKLRIISSGWHEKDGKVNLEASQKVTSDKGVLILVADSLFKKDSIESISAKDARYINLTFWLEEVTELFDYITVEFKVWDKSGKGQLSGFYRLYLK